VSGENRSTVGIPPPGTLADDLLDPRSSAEHAPRPAGRVGGALPPGGTWRRLTTADADVGADAGIGVRAVVLRIAAAAVLVIVVVVIAGAFASRRLAERESVNDAAHTTDLFAESVVQPALHDGILDGDPASTATLRAATANLDAADIVRVKLWTPDGRVVFSDDPRLVGEVFPLAQDERAVFSDPKTKAEVTNLARPENRLEQGQGKLLEVYRPVWTPSGRPLLFETYSRYHVVVQRSGQIWRGLAGVTLTSLLLLVVCLIPLSVRLVGSLRRAQSQREALLHRAVDASAEERRRIAGSLHDGPVQDLAATSFVLTAAAGRTSTTGDPDSGAALNAAASEVRENIRGLRSLLVDIYPAGLSSAGLGAALSDLAGSVRGHGLAVSLVLPDEGLPPLETASEQLVFRIAQEALRNAAKHASARTAELRLARSGDAVVFEVCDDGVGFDAEAVLSAPPEGHFGLRLMTDLAQQTGADLDVATGPGQGTRWRLTMPVADPGLRSPGSGRGRGRAGGRDEVGDRQGRVRGAPGDLQHDRRRGTA
jgi:signal transduction histidine kinase